MSKPFTAVEVLPIAEEDLIAFCRDLYQANGFEALTYNAMQQNYPKLYMRLYKRGLNKAVLIDRLSLSAEFAEHQANRPKTYAGKVRVPWTWERVVTLAGELTAQHGHVPSAPWFQRHELGAAVHFVYRSGRTWDQVQSAVGGLSQGRFVESRNGFRWLSHAEASLSNFLYARGVEHRKGERYPAPFSEGGDARYGLYDMHFKAADGEWIDVEVWGDNPKGQQPEKYARRRESKETFNRENSRFLGISHKACYDDGHLEKVLHPHIGLLKPFVFSRPFDPVIPSTHWSNADELLTFCRTVAAVAPGGVFPAEDWLRKRGRWAERPGKTYNTLAVYIRLWLGGIRNVRKLLDQSHASTLQWDEDRALNEYRRFFEEHGRTPGQVAGDRYSTVSCNAMNADVLADAVRINTAVEKYAGGALEAQRRLGVACSRRYWTAESVRDAFSDFCKQHGITPSQAAGRWTSKATNALHEKDSKYAVRLTQAYRKHVGPIPRGLSVDDVSNWDRGPLSSGYLTMRSS